MILLKDLVPVEFEASDTTSFVAYDSAAEENEGVKLFISSFLNQFIKADENGDIHIPRNIELPNGGKILFREINESGTEIDYAIVFIGDYANVVNPITGEIYARWLQTEVGNTHIPLTPSTANNPLTGKYIAYDVGSWVLDPENYPSLPKQIIATFTEGTLNLESKYFTPINNGSGSYSLQGITWAEMQTNFYKYSAGLTNVQTNTNGFVSRYIDSFTINDAVITFQYRFAIADFDSGIINVWQALISATESGIATPCNLLHSYQLPNA